MVPYSPRTPVECLGAAVDHAARGGQPGLPETLPSPTGETKNCPRASASLISWSLKGVRDLYSVRPPVLR